MNFSNQSYDAYLIGNNAYSEIVMVIVVEVVVVVIDSGRGNGC